MKYIKTFENFDSQLNEEFFGGLTKEMIIKAKQHGINAANSMTPEEREKYLELAKESGVKLDDKTMETLVDAAKDPDSIEGAKQAQKALDDQSSSYTYINEGIISYIKGIKGKIIDRIGRFIINPVILAGMGFATKFVVQATAEGATGRSVWQAGLREFLDSCGLTGFATMLIIFITAIFALYTLVRFTTTKKGLISGSGD